MKVKQLFLPIVVASLNYGGVVAQDNCDNVCASKVAEVTAASDQKIAALEAELSNVKAQLDSANADSASRMESLQGEVNGLSGKLEATTTSLDEYKEMLLQSKAQAEKYKDTITQTSNNAAIKLAALENDLMFARKEAESYANSKVIVNMDVIKKEALDLVETVKGEFKALLQKAGLVKDDEL